MNERGSRADVRLVSFEARQAHRRVVAELGPEGHPERLDEVGPGIEHEP